jgi:monoamine oxidase
MPGFNALTSTLRRTLAAHGESERTGVPVDELLGRAEETRRAAAEGPSRRAVLGAGLGIAGATVLGSAPAAAVGPRAARATDPTVVIVGAGLSGLRAAHWLWTVKGIRSTVYEASERLGGRVWTLRDHFSDGLTVEHGGAFINTDHNAIRNLVNSLGLSLYEVAGGAQPPFGDVYWADGIYTYQEATADWGEA